MICYVGGTGGDFLKTLCLQQLELNAVLESNITDTGLVLHNRRYFRDICVDYYNNNCTNPNNLDLSQIDPVENSHYYFDWFPRLTNNFYYIDFPESAAVGIVDVYISKRHQSDVMHFVETQQHTLPKWTQQKITLQNARQIFSVLWFKQLRQWQHNTNLQPIQLVDFFDQHKLIQIVEQLTQQPINNVDRFNSTFLAWTQKNTTLRKLVGSSIE